MTKERKRKKKEDQSERPQVKESATLRQAQDTATPVAIKEPEEAHPDPVGEAEAMSEEAGKGEGVAVADEEKVQPAATKAPRPVGEAVPVNLCIPVQELRGALELLEPAVPRKTTLPILANVLVGEGYAVATDLEVAVKVALPEVGGPVLLPHKGVLEFLKYSPGHETAVITVESKNLTIAVGTSQVGCPAEFHGDYPLFPQSQTDHEGVLAGDALVKALTAVLPYVAKEQDRPILTGVALRLGDQVEVAAADGFRLAWRSISGRLPGDGVIVLPSKAVNVLERLWKRAAAPDLSHASTPAQVSIAKRLIRLEWGAERLRMQFGQMTLVTQLLQGQFPNYRPLIPTEKGASVAAMVEDVQRGLRQLGPRGKSDAGVVRLQWEGNGLGMAAITEDGPKTQVTVPAHATAPGRVALNIHYLMEYCKGKEGSITISTQAETSPVTFTYHGVMDCVVMPMNVNW